MPLNPFQLTDQDKLTMEKIYFQHAINNGLLDPNQHPSINHPAVKEAIASFGISTGAIKPAVAPKPVDPMLELLKPYVGAYGYNFSGTGLWNPAANDAPKISIPGVITIDDQGAVVCSDTAHPGDNRPGQAHPGWLNFRDFMITVDPETGGIVGQLLAHWHANTGVLNVLPGTPTPIGPWGDCLFSTDLNSCAVDFTQGSNMYLKGPMFKQ